MTTPTRGAPIAAAAALGAFAILASTVSAQRLDSADFEGVLLTYTPQNVKTNDGWHAVTIRVPNRDAHVTAPAGYYAGR